MSMTFDAKKARELIAERERSEAAMQAVKVRLLKAEDIKRRRRARKLIPEFLDLCLSKIAILAKNKERKFQTDIDNQRDDLVHLRDLECQDVESIIEFFKNKEFEVHCEVIRVSFQVGDDYSHRYLTISW